MIGAASPQGGRDLSRRATILKLPGSVGGKTPRIEMALVSKNGREGDWLCGVGIAQPEF